MESKVMGSLEASELGWSPGKWPPAFERYGVVWYRVRQMVNGEEFAGYVYRDHKGNEISVFND